MNHSGTCEWPLRIRRQKSRQTSSQFRNPRRGHTPHPFKINPNVVVDENIPHAANAFPVHLRQQAPRLRRDPLRCLSDHFDIPDHCVLKSLGFKELFPPLCNESSDPIAALNHVEDV